MATYVLVPGAGGAAWYWHLVVPLLKQAGHDAIAVDLPGDDSTAGLQTYADLVIAAIGSRSDVVLVAQSMGGFTAAIVAARVPIARLVFVNAMIPVPGETPGEWWDNTGSEEARKKAAELGGYGVEFDLTTYFLHDLSADLIREIAAHERPEAELAFTERATFTAWPDVPIHVVVGRDDRFFPREFQERVARERLGRAIDVVPGGHLVALSFPRELADRLLACQRD